MINEAPTIQNYSGRNPFLLKLRAKSALTDFDTRYIQQNLLFGGLPFRLSLNVGRQTSESLNKQFKTPEPKNIESVKIDYLWGETDEIYHFSFKGRDFFCLKEDTENPFSKRLDMVTFDEIYWNSRIKDGKKLFPYQVEGIKYMMSMPNCFNLDDMGLGKTIQSIVAVLASGCKKILVITLASVKINWRREIQNIGETVKILSGKEWIEDDTTFTVVNYEILKNFDFSDKGYDALIVDECHRVKHPTSQQSKAVTKLSESASLKKIIGLSGTLIEKNVEFFNICRSMGMSVETIISNKTPYFWQKKMAYENFATRYCNAFEMPFETPKVKREKAEIASQIADSHRSHQKFKPLLTRIQQMGVRKSDGWHIFNKSVRNLAKSDVVDILTAEFEDRRKKIFILKENINTVELYQRAKGWIIRRKKTDVLECFPEKFVFPIFSTLSLSQKREYNKLWAEYLQETGRTEAQTDHSQSVKVREFFATVKCPATVDFVEGKLDGGNKIILYTHFKSEFDFFVQKLGDKQAVHVHASMTGEQKQAQIDRFQKDPNIGVIIGNIKTLGTGHNLTAADCVVFNSPDWNSGENEQAQDRAWRLGRNDDVTVFNMLLEGTHEEDVFNRANEKKENKQIFLK